MKIHKLSLEGLLLIEPDVYKDDRGYFIELFHEQKFTDSGLPFQFSQDNLSFSNKNVIRGLHFQQSPFVQGKLVRVLKGAVRDVVVDIRKESPTFGRHEIIQLDESNNHVLWIPPDFAHGFSVLQDGTLFLYKCTFPYNKNAEFGIRFDDEELNINWGIVNPVVSDKDRTLMSFAEYKKMIALNKATV